MTNDYSERTKFTEMPPLSDISEEDIIPVVHSGKNYHISFKNLVRGLVDKIGGFIDSSAIKLLEYRGMQPTDKFGTPAEEQLAALYNGGYVRPFDRPINVPYIATAHFEFFDLTTQPKVFPPVTTMGEVGGFTLPLAGINTLTYDMPHVGSDFQTVGINERGFTAFRFIREHNAYAVLNGRLDVLVRISSHENVKNVMPPAAYLSLVTSPLPPYENGGYLGIGIDGVHDNVQVKKLNGYNLKYEILPMPSYEEAYAVVQGTQPILLEMVNGQIELGDTKEELTLDKSAVHRTTDWFPVGSEQVLIAKANGTTNVSMVQWKDEYGEVYFDYVNSEEYSGNCDRLYYFPPNARWARICFRAAGAVTATRLDLWYLPQEMNPYAGQWAHYSFNICKDVEFVKDTQYHFELELVGNSVDKETNTHGLIVLSGGLSANINVRDHVQLSFERMQERENGEPI